MGETQIEWATKTWNPVNGCSPVSAGCANCWAMRTTWRLAHNPGCGDRYVGLVRRGDNGRNRPHWTGEVRMDHEALYDPLRWRRPSRIFVCSRADLFHEKLDDSEIAWVWAVMALAHWHTFIVLTKRPARMRRLLNDQDFLRLVDTHISMSLEDEASPAARMWNALARRRDDAMATALIMEGGGPLPNVWVGVTAEDQAAADERIPELLATPAAVRWVSVEPMLGPVDLSEWIAPVSICHSCGAEHEGHVPGDCPSCKTDNLLTAWGFEQAQRTRENARTDEDMDKGPLLSWVVAGGESGPGARPCAMEWIESVVRQCRAASVPVFVKQLGALVVSEQRTAPAALMSRPPAEYEPDFIAPNGEVWAWRAGLRHPKGGDPAEWPADLRVREYPEAGRA